MIKCFNNVLQSDSSEKEAPLTKRRRGSFLNEEQLYALLFVVCGIIHAFRFSLKSRILFFD